MAPKTPIRINVGGINRSWRRSPRFADAANFTPINQGGKPPPPGAAGREGATRGRAPSSTQQQGRGYKRLLYIINFPMLLAGVAVAVIAGWALADRDSAVLALPHTAAVGACVFGGFVALVSLLGVVGACRHSRFLLALYLLLLVAGFVAQLVAGAVVLTHARELAAAAQGAGYYDNSGAVRAMEDAAVQWATTRPGEWVKVQDAGGCCGYDLRVTLGHRATMDTGAACAAAAAGTEALLRNLQANVTKLEGGGMRPSAALAAAAAAAGPALRAAYGRPLAAYYCKAALLASGREHAFWLGLGAMFLAVVQCGAAWAACCLACMVPRVHGGYADEPLSPSKAARDRRNARRARSARRQGERGDDDETAPLTPTSRALADAFGGGGKMLKMREYAAADLEAAGYTPEPKPAARKKQRGAKQAGRKEERRTAEERWEEPDRAPPSRPGDNARLSLSPTTPFTGTQGGGNQKGKGEGENKENGPPSQLAKAMAAERAKRKKKKQQQRKKNKKKDKKEKKKDKDGKKKKGDRDLGII